MERPELKNVPMAVAGDPEERVGIVVAKNELAKKYGVKTTDMTFRRDLHTRDEIETGVAVQVDRIAMSLRRQDLKGSVVSVNRKKDAARKRKLLTESSSAAYTLVNRDFFMGIILLPPSSLALSKPGCFIFVETAGYHRLLPSEISRRVAVKESLVGNNSPRTTFRRTQGRSVGGDALPRFSDGILQEKELWTANILNILSSVRRHI